MGKQVKVMVFPVGEPGEVRVVDSGLESYQALVEGWIEAVTLKQDAAGSITVYCDEEGKLKGKSNNAFLADDDGHIYDVLVGQFFVARDDANGDPTDLTEEDIEFAREKFDR